MTEALSDDIEKQLYAKALHKAAQDYDELVGELSILKLLNDSLRVGMGFSEICQKLVQFVTEAMDVENASILVIDHERQELRLLVAKSFKEKAGSLFVNRDWTGKSFKLGEGVAGQVAEKRKSVFINDTDEDPRFVKTPGQKVGVRSLLSLPLIHGNRLHGVFNLSNSEPGVFDSRSEHALNIIASTASVALSHAIAVEELQELNRELASRNKELAAVINLSESLHTNLDPAAVFTEALNSVLEGLEIDSAAIFLAEEKNGHTTLRSYRTCSETPLPERLVQSLGNKFGAKIARSLRPLAFPGPLDTECGEEYAAREVRACTGVPLHIRDHCLGFLLALTSKEGGLGEAKTKLLSSFCSEISMAIHNSTLISRLKENIREREEAQKALVESERRYSTTLDSVPDMVFESTLNRTIVYANRPALEKMGYCVDDLNKIRLSDILDEDEWDEAFRENGSVSEDGRPSHHMQCDLKGKDGRTIPVEIHATIFERTGQPPTVLSVARDITERKRAGEEKEQLEAQLQRAQKMEAIGTLAGGIAHDLNNVLSGIVGYPELLLLDLPEDSPLRKPIQTMQQSGQKAATIVQDMLTLARSGVQVKEVVNLNSVIYDYLASPECEELKTLHPGVHMEVDLEADLLNALGSPVHLSKTVMNLVSNAAEAMPEGGKVVIRSENRHVDVPVEGYDHVEIGEYVVLEVSDTGVGLSREEMSRIFEPFYTKKVMGRSGTGLGTSVVWRTVKDHNGFIDLKSRQGHGTTFTLYFPATRQHVSEKDTGLSLDCYSSAGETVLVVDDVQEQREVATDILRRLGYKVETARSGEEAIEYMKSSRADIVILDMIMEPGIDGLETYRRILELHSGQKAVIASGFSETALVKEAQLLGAGTYVKKPYTLEKIGMAVRNELDR